MPTLRETLDHLLDLQKADKECDRIAKALHDLDTGRAADADAVKAYEASLAANSALHKAQGELKDAELELAGVEKKIKQYEQKMSGGQSSSAKELMNIEREISQLVRIRASLDEKILILMEQNDSLQVAAAHAEATSIQKEEHRKAVIEASTQRRRLLDGQLTAANQQRQAALELVDDPTLLAKYQALRGKPSNGGVAIALTVENTCGACHMQAAAVDIRHAKERTELTLCPDCGRIMA